MNTVIDTCQGQFRMSIIYDKTTNIYILIFSSTRDNKGQQYTCKSFADAVDRFVKNCRFYDAHMPTHIPTEQEFLGIPDGVWPQPKKEVIYAKNRA